jgi:hypothetical protein
MNPWHKLAFLVGWVAAGFLVSWLIGLMLSPVISPFVSIPLDLVAQVALARSFRGLGEQVQPPRLWWRLTARPLAGWWLSVFYLWGVLGLFRGERSLADWIVAAEFLFLAAAFLNSSIRLTAFNRRARRAQ